MHGLTSIFVNFSTLSVTGSLIIGKLKEKTASC